MQSPIHPGIKIVLWIALAVSLQRMETIPLLIASGLVLTLLAGTGFHLFIRLVRRVRWLLLSLALIYGFATPGTALMESWGLLSPTIQGLELGGAQLWRLLVLLGALALLLATTDRNQLLGGLYTLMRIFRPLRLNPERVALRIWLTLDYAERLSRFERGSGWRRFQEALAAAVPAESVTLPTTSITARDLVAAAVGIAVLGWLAA